MAKKRAGGVLVTAKDTGRVLLLLRCKGSRHELTWGLISGGIEEGEDPLEGTKREVNEETQFDYDSIEYKHIHDEDSDEMTFHYYEGLTDSEITPILCHENIDWGWFDVNDLPEPLYPEIDKKIDGREFKRPE